MDKELRELERKAHTDLDSALKLIRCLQKLQTDQWGVVLCSQCKGNGAFTPRSLPGYGVCKKCDGDGAFRVNISNLRELSSLKKRHRDKGLVNKELEGTLVHAPKAAEGTHTYLVSYIHIHAGKYVHLDAVAVELETDKAGLAVPAPVAGIVGKIFIKEGETIEPGDPLFTIMNDTFRS